MITNYKDFFKRIHGDAEVIVKAHTHGSKDMHIIKATDIEKENKAGREIYFVVNQGGDNNEAINKFTACFIDLDAGKNSNKEYKSNLEVAMYKHECLTALEGYLAPSIIVETRNGYHAYWLLEDGCSRTDWEVVENKLISKFNSDKQVKNPARLLRVPFTNWMKDTANPFMVKVAADNDVRYSIEELKNSLKNVSEASKIKASKAVEKKGIHIDNIMLCIPQNSKCIKASDIKGLRALVEQKHVVLSSDAEAIEFIKTEVDMAEFLGIDNPKSFNCIIHEDNNPSAGIIVSENGHQIYNCFSSNCGFKGDIISVVAHLMDSSRGRAIRFIKEVCDIIVEVPEHIKAQKENLQENIRMIIDGEIKETFPAIHSALWRYTSDLILLHTIAQEHLGISTDEKNVMFFVSQRHLAALLGAAQSKISTRTAMFALLKLCIKVDDKDVPADLYAKAKAEQIKNEVRDTIQFYSIPSYTWAALKEVNEKAEAWNKNGCTMKGMSREMIYRAFGEEEADRVYPKRKCIVPTEKSDEFQYKFETLLLKAIKKNGYAKEADVVAKMNGWKEVNETMAKRILTESLNNLGLVRERANKDLKNKYGIKGDGYPFIIHN